MYSFIRKRRPKGGEFFRNNFKGFWQSTINALFLVFTIYYFLGLLGACGAFQTVYFQTPLTNPLVLQTPLRDPLFAQTPLRSGGHPPTPRGGQYGIRFGRKVKPVLPKINQIFTAWGKSPYPRSNTSSWAAPVQARIPHCKCSATITFSASETMISWRESISWKCVFWND